MCSEAENRQKRSGALVRVLLSMQPEEAKLIRKKQHSKNHWYEKMPCRAVEVDCCRQRDADKYADETVPDRAHDDEGALYAVPTGLTSAFPTDNYSVQHADYTE